MTVCATCGMTHDQVPYCIVGPYAVVKPNETMVRHIKRAHVVTIVVRKDGVETSYDGGFLKTFL